MERARRGERAGAGDAVVVGDGETDGARRVAVEGETGQRLGRRVTANRPAGPVVVVQGPERLLHARLGQLHAVPAARVARAHLEAAIAHRDVAAQHDRQH